MNDLIEQLERAMGPDRQLDRLIEETLPGVRQHHDKRMVADGYVLEGNGVQAYLPPPYTGSIDAALTLVPDSCDWEMSKEHRITSGVIYRCEVGPSPLVKADTPSLAICIAVLKVRAGRVLEQ